MNIDLTKMAKEYFAPFKAHGGERLGQFDVGDLSTFAIQVAEAVLDESQSRLPNNYAAASHRVILDNLKRELREGKGGR